MAEENTTRKTSEKKEGWRYAETISDSQEENILPPESDKMVNLISLMLKIVDDGEEKRGRNG